MRSSLLAASVAAAFLAGCGGGGGSTPSPSSGGAPQNSSLSPSDIAASATLSGFDAVDSAQTDADLGDGGLGAASRARGTESIGFACRHRRTRTVTVNPDSSITVETIDYYDNACTEPERDAVAVFVASGGTATVTRTITTYSLTHAQLGQRKESFALTGSFSNGSWTVESAFYPGTSATPMSQFAHEASVSGSAYTASTGRTVNDANPTINAEYGHQVATMATIGTDASNDTTFTGTRNATYFKGALNALMISAAPPFTVSGGTQLGTGTISGTVAFTSDGVLASVNLTGTLAGGNAITVTSTADAAGNVTVSGTITAPGGATVATFTTDANGNGVLTLTATGTQVPIVDWHVIWA
jgi:hypothetical protein